VAYSELVSMSICVICSEGTFVAEWCCLAKEFSLPNFVVCGESTFVAEIALSPTNLCSLPKLCVYSESTFTAQICVVCNELGFY